MPATETSLRALIPPLNRPKTEPTAHHPRRLSLQGWLTLLVCIGAGLVYLSLAMQSLPVFLIGESICVLLAPFVIWGERRHIRAWLKSRGTCGNCGLDLRGIKGPCPGCGRKRIVD